MPAAFLLGGGPDRASGPFFKVDHWLLAFPGFRAFFLVSGRASGPLDGVNHWLLTFSQFSALFPSFRPS